MKGFSSIVPPDADVLAVAEAIVKVVILLSESGLSVFT